MMLHFILPDNLAYDLFMITEKHKSVFLYVCELGWSLYLNFRNLHLTRLSVIQLYVKRVLTKFWTNWEIGSGAAATLKVAEFVNQAQQQPLLNACLFHRFQYS